MVFVSAAYAEIARKEKTSANSPKVSLISNIPLSKFFFSFCTS